MLEGLMQHDHPLTLQHVLDRMATLYADSEVVTVRDGGRSRASYAEVVERAARLASGLASLGVRPGDRVATFSWNTQEHFEAYLAAPCMGAVLHTLNIRLFSEQLEYIVNHAEDRVVLVDPALAPVFAELLPRLSTVEHVVVLGTDAGGVPGAVALEDLLGAQEPGFDWPRLDDRMAAGLCYTSGTTGNPKGVLYSHRSNVLHALAQCLAISMGLRTEDRVLPVVPMFHANAWGLPYSSALVGADLVLPGPHLQAERLADLIETERVTVAGAVPTIWMDLLRHADEHHPDLSSLRMVACGGSAVPLSLMRDFEERHGVRIVQAWGMNETRPLGSIAFPPPGAEGEDHWRHRATAGRPLPLVEARVVGPDGSEQPWDGESTGELEVRGPWICAEYYRDPAGEEKFDDGWLRTGDVAAIDPKGYIRISDRAKDVIKSGGEWISSVDLEVELMAHPAVAEAAVIAKPDDRWSERPLACVVVAEGQTAPSAEELAAHLRDRVAKWWIPDEFAFIDEVPKTSVGKFDKKLLRRALEEGRLEDRRMRVNDPTRPEAQAAARPG